MTETMIDLPGVIARSDDADFLRDLIQDAAQRLMDIEVAAVCGAGHGERSPDRENQRNGYRPRQWDTRAGAIGRKTSICHSDDESGRCNAFGACEVCRNLPPFTLLSSTISTRNAVSTHEPISSETAPPLSPSGANSARHKGQPPCPWRDRFELV